MTDMLSIRNLTVKFRGLVAVKNFSMDVKAGDFHSLIGPNGAGKTTVINAITRVVPANGTALLENVNLLKVPAHKISYLGVARTFQNLELFPTMTVMGNLIVGAYHTINYGILDEIFKTSRYKSESFELMERVIEVADFLSIKEYLNTVVSNLPYGIQKTVEIARAIMSKPRILLLDEPFAGLNDTETDRLKEELLRVKKAYNITVLMIEHDMGTVMSLSNRITVINFGEKIAEGTPEEIKQNRKVAEAYLGDRAFT